MSKVIKLTQASSSTCLQLHQSRLSLVLMGFQEAQVVLCPCLQNLALPEQMLVAGLDAGEEQGALAVQPGLCVQGVKHKELRRQAYPLSNFSHRTSTIGDVLKEILRMCIFLSGLLVLFCLFF